MKTIKLVSFDGLDPFRVWNKVHKTGGCFVWIGCKSATGYGHIKINDKVEKAHRVAYFLANGPFPKDNHVLHKCDNPSCIKPGHLFLGSHIDNMRDMTKKGRNISSKRTHCPKGHPYSGYNLKITLGARTCRKCRNEQWNAWAHKSGRAKERSRHE